MALFNFTSQNPDELPISENEELTIIMGQCDEEGWLMAVNARGDRGYVPENYIEIRSAPAQGLPQQQSFDSGGPPGIMHQVSSGLKQQQELSRQRITLYCTSYLVLGLHIV